MKIPAIETKFNIGDVVWFMYENKPTRGIVTSISISYEESTWDVNSHTIPNLVKKIKDGLKIHKKELRVLYSLDMITNDDRFGAALSGGFYHWQLGKTKEDLFSKL